MTNAVTEVPLARLGAALRIGAWVCWSAAVVVLIADVIIGFDLRGFALATGLAVLGLNLVIWRPLSGTISRMATLPRKLGLGIGAGALMAGISVVVVFLVVLAGLFAVLAWP